MQHQNENLKNFYLLESMIIQIYPWSWRASNKLPKCFQCFELDKCLSEIFSKKTKILIPEDFIGH